MMSSEWSEDGLEFKAAWDRPFHDDAGDAEHQLAVSAWDAERARLREQAGLPALERRRVAMLERLEEASLALAEMQSTTLSCAKAKATAWLTIDQGGSGTAE